MDELTIFDMIYPKLKIDKPIRLIELFAGYGSQALALKYLGIPFEHWKICEWAIKSIQAYKDIHFTNKETKFNPFLTKEQKVQYLYEIGISNNYNNPMTREQISKLKEENIDNIIKNINITHNLVNIQKVKGKDLEIKDKDKYEYVMTYSFPCQDLSLAGKGKGMSDISTRSGMLWEVERILKECKEINALPQILLMENVPQVHGSENIDDFNKWQLSLEEMGYKNYWQDLIATDYGIPQTRNRCFMISILGDYSYRFPTPIPLKLKLKDLLEENVDEKYYLSDKMVNYISNDNEKWTGNNGEALINKTYASTLNTGEGSKRCDASNYISNDVGENYNLKVNKSLRETLENNEIKDGVSFVDSYNRKIRDDDLTSTITTGIDYRNNNFIAIKTPKLLGGFGEKKLNNNTQWYQQDRVYDSDNVAICLSTVESFQPNYAIKIKNATKKGYLEATDSDGIDISSRMEYHRGNVQKDKIQTLTTQCDRGVVVESNLKKELCNELIKDGKVEENDVIRHSYTASRMKGEMKDMKQNNISPTLDTRCDCLGIVINPLKGKSGKSWQFEQQVYDENGSARTLKASEGSGNIPKVVNNLRIRKLTPRECFRLMGVKDEDYEKCAKNQSNASLYHLAGDSIVVNVLMEIFKEMVDD